MDTTTLISLAFGSGNTLLILLALLFVVVHFGYAVMQTYKAGKQVKTGHPVLDAVATIIAQADPANLEAAVEGLKKLFGAPSATPTGHPVLDSIRAVLSQTTADNVEKSLETIRHLLGLVPPALPTPPK